MAAKSAEEPTKNRREEFLNIYKEKEPVEEDQDANSKDLSNGIKFKADEEDEDSGF